MRKIFAFEVASVDGYYEGPNHEFDWPVVDEEFNQFAVEQLDEADTLLFGRATYEVMASFWPTPMAEQSDPEVARRMNGYSKIVVSRTLGAAGWANTRVVGDDVAGEIARLKQEPGRDIAIFGSFALTVNLLMLGLVDEIRIMVSPVVLGGGASLFHTADERIRLTLRNVRTFASGNVLLTYEPAISEPARPGAK
jgi:dihydrofolate reductase